MRFGGNDESYGINPVLVGESLTLSSLSRGQLKFSAVLWNLKDG